MKRKHTIDSAEKYIAAAKHCLLEARAEDDREETTEDQAIDCLDKANEELQELRRETHTLLSFSKKITERLADLTADDKAYLLRHQRKNTDKEYTNNNKK